MNNELIKTECEHLYAQIKQAQDRLKAIRSECKHEHTFEGLYEWRVAFTYRAVICSYCLTPLKNLDIK